MARRKTGDKKPTRREVVIPKVQADDHSIAFEEIHVAGNVGGDIRIGHTIGYTADQVSVLLKQITTTLQPKKFDGRCPYKGLDVFEEEDAELFFGRERLVEDLIGRVKESRTVFITGPSGSGKSSLVRAGLIHALKHGKIKSSERWLYETMKPGREPIKDLALAFSRLKSPELEDYFLAHVGETDVLNKCAESVLSGRKDQRFVLFVDQFEEVFTQISGEEERLAFINMLAHAGTLETGRVIVLFAMRSDFVSNCATYPLLNELLSQEFRQIGAMQPEELVSAIALPARHVGLPIEDELIARIINDMKGEPGALPLMQFALKDLFDSQQEKGGVITLTLVDYLKHGGIHKSLERHADATFAKLSESEQELARSIFSGLIEIGRGTQDTKRTALFDELIPANMKAEDVLDIVQKLADARLIITDEQAGKETVTISHEKLIEAWPWLKKLVNENRDVIALQNEIANDAKEWDEHKRDASYLYTGARLLNSLEQLKAKKLALTSAAGEFVQASRIRKQRGQLTLISGVSTFFILLILAVVVFRDQAQANIKIANTAQAASTEAVAQKATAQANAEEALARQLAAEAKSIVTGDQSSKQMTAVLLAIQSMKIFPSSEAAQVLLNNNFAARPVAFMTHDGEVTSVAFSPNGKFVVSGGWDNTTRVWETATGKEVARISHNGNGRVNLVAFSSDGKYVVSGSDDNTARVWETATGKEVARITHDSPVYSVAFSPDGNYVVSGSVDGLACVWEALSGREVTCMTHNGTVNSVAFSPDGNYIVTGSWDDTARVWEVATGKEVARMTHSSDVFSVALNPNGDYVVSGSVDGTARVWEAFTGKEVARMTHNSWVDSVAFSPNGNYVVTGSQDHTARVWEAFTGKEVARMTHDDVVLSVAFSPDGKYVVSGSFGGDNTARVWEAFTGKEVARMTHDGAVRSVAFSPNGDYVVSGSWDNTVRVWETATDKEVTRMMHDSGIWSVAYSPDGKYVVSGSYDFTARIWEVFTGKEVARITHDGYVDSVAFSPDGKYVVSGSCDKVVGKNCIKGTALMWEASTGKEVARMTHQGTVRSVTFSPNGDYVVSGGDDGAALVWEAFTGKEVARITHDDVVHSVAFSPNGNYIVSGSHDHTARVWEAFTGKEIARMTHDDVVYSVVFSPDGKYVVSGSEDKTARVWEAFTGKEVARMTHNATVNSAVFSLDGNYVVSGSGDTSSRVWEAFTGKEVARMTHDSNVESVAFSPNGDYVISGSWDNTARVWETTTGKEVARMTHDEYVQSVAFSPDGEYVLSGSLDNTIRIWLWQPNDLIANACKDLPRNLTPIDWKKYIGDSLPYPTKQEDATCPNLRIETEPTPTVAP